MSPAAAILLALMLTPFAVSFGLRLVRARVHSHGRRRHS